MNNFPQSLMFAFLWLCCPYAWACEWGARRA